MKPISILKTALMLAPFTAVAQHMTFPDHERQRGYYDAPYLRYEAEPGMCDTDGSFLDPPVPYSQQPLQAEASNLTALTLERKDSYVGWILDASADAITLRFSIPDAPDGKGLKTTIDIYSGNDKITSLTLDSYWSWQYTSIANSTEKYPDRTPSASKFARMRFDEVSSLLGRELREGSMLRLVKAEDDGVPVTVDFIELENAGTPLTAADFPDDDVVIFDGNGSSLQSFISANAGKRILIAPGIYDVPSGLSISNNNTRISGSGMWHTTLRFTADPDSRLTFGDRGVTCEADNVELSNLSLTTVSRTRYWPGKSSLGSGKALMGSWGRNSTVSHVRADHFECGVWIANYSGRQMENLTVTHCRFRNNYADGINLCQGTSGGKVTHCSFRNNGDDDMASWSAGDWARNHEFAWNTAENNWRASSLGIFGGEGHRAHHLLVIDAMEAGIRANGEFGGTGFSDNSECSMTDISIYRSGCVSGTPGTQGGFWGSQQGAVDIQAGGQYGIINLRLANIDIHDSRSHGVRFSSSNGKHLQNIQMHNIHIDGHGENCWAICCESNSRGDGEYTGITFGGKTTRRMSDIPQAFDFKGEFLRIVSCVSKGKPMSVTARNGCLTVSGLPAGSTTQLTDLKGNTTVLTCSTEGTTTFHGLKRGIYVISAAEFPSCKIAVAE